MSGGKRFFSVPQGTPSLVGETRAIDKTQKSPESQGNCGAPSWLLEWRGKGLTASSSSPQSGFCGGGSDYKARPAGTV